LGPLLIELLQRLTIAPNDCYTSLSRGRTFGWRYESCSHYYEINGILLASKFDSVSRDAAYSFAVSVDELDIWLIESLKVIVVEAWALTPNNPQSSSPSSAPYSST